MSAHRTDESGSGLWPTPQTVDGKKKASPLRKKKDRQTRNETPGSYRGDLADHVVHRRTYPTPATRDYRSPNLKPYAERGGGKKGEQLPNAIRHGGTEIRRTWQTPTAGDVRGGHTSRGGARKNELLLVGQAKDASGQTDGQLNPFWVEWLMGWPIGWTDLKPLAMDRFQQWLEHHGIFKKGVTHAQDPERQD